MLPALATAVVFDWLAVRLDAEKATGLAWKIDWHFTDRGEVVAHTLENATLTQRIAKPSAAPHARVTTTRTAFDRVVAGGTTFEDIVASGEAQVMGDGSLPGQLFAMLDVFQPMFPVVTAV
jgi:alkyl sulfatase BDS1-like metallo-beta-lactamase superfamily hydrolase